MICLVRNIYTYKKYIKMHTGRKSSEKNFATLKNTQICGNKLYKMLSLSKKTVADDKILKESSMKVKHLNILIIDIWVII